MHHLQEYNIVKLEDAERATTKFTGSALNWFKEKHGQLGQLDKTMFDSPSGEKDKLTFEEVVKMLDDQYSEDNF